MKDLIVEAIELRKYYQRGEETVKALDGVSLEIKEGDFIALVGVSGSGKTTLMNLLGLLDVPSGGLLKIDGLEVSRMREAERVKCRQRSIGFIFQRDYLLPTLTVAQNILLPLLFSGQTASKEEVEEVMEKVGLGGKGKLYPEMLSGGDRQKVAIARALMKRPRLLLADEPTARLESKAREEILRIFNGLCADGVAIVMATHDLDLAREAHRILYLQDGRLVSKEESMLWL